jgi:hypothetical protein
MLPALKTAGVEILFGETPVADPHAVSRFKLAAPISTNFTVG